MTFEFFISRRYFRSKPRQTIIALITLLSVIGVAIGVTALIVVIAVMAGFESDLKTRILGIEPHVVIDRNRSPITDYADIIARASQTTGVRAAWPLVELQAMLRADSRVSGALIKGVEPEAARMGLGMQSLAALTSPLTVSDPPGLPPIVLGRDLAQRMGLSRGDTMFVVSPKGTLAPIGFVPFMKRFMVADLFETGMYEYDGGLAFMNLEDAQILARARESVDAIEMRVDRLFEAAAIGRSVIAGLDGPLRVRDWAQLNRNLFSALKLEKAAMFITLTLIILVATFSITSSLVMLVMEKTKDIAVLRALGASARSIRRIFMIQGLLIGTLGTVIGVTIGTTLCLLQDHYQLIRLPGDVYYITALPVNLNIGDLAMVALSALAISFLATLYPAHQAARLNPVEAIRYG
jgi:lipoprotein-releasing system permease protein